MTLTNQFRTVVAHRISAPKGRQKGIDIIVPERLREPHWRGFEAAMRAVR